jgi:cytochrome P450
MLYDPYSRDMQHDPYPTYRHFRDEEPCHYNSKMNFYALFRFEDVWAGSLDWQGCSSRLGHDITSLTDPGESGSIIAMDPPRQNILRRLVAKGFTPARIDALEGEMRRIAGEFLDPLMERDEVDLQAEFGMKYPMDVIGALVGFPKEAREPFRQWADLALRRDPETGAPHPAAAAAGESSRAFVREVLEARRKKPEDDLMSILAQSEYEDVDGKKKLLSDEEVVGFITLLGNAGAETTAKLIGNCLVYLSRDQKLRERLWDDASLIPAAIEEILRYDAPSQFQGRVAGRTMEFHNVTIPEGARVALVTGAACRDEREFENPDVIDFDRPRNRQLYFGQGQHFCLGKSLARLESRIALEELRTRFPNYEVLEEGLTRTYQAHVRGFATVPIQTNRRSRTRN